MFFSRRRLLRLVDAERVRSAIEAAEERTSGEIRVSVSRWFWGSVRSAAELAFERMRMHETSARNGVLIFVVPSRKRFVVLGDRGIHERVGAEFWEKVAGAMAVRFREGDFTGGLELAVATVGEELSRFFPFDPTTDRNELPNQIDLGPSGKHPS